MVAAQEQIFRTGLLSGISIAVTSSGEFYSELNRRSGELGGEIQLASELELRSDSQSEGSGLRVVVTDLTALAATSEAIEEDDPQVLLSENWELLQRLAEQWLIPTGSGRIITLAPYPGEANDILRAALENLTRTLSTEWLRYGVNTVCLLPGANTTTDELVDLSIYLASPAGDYYSGCSFELGMVT